MTDGLDIFTQINNAVLDLQAADVATYERPLKTLSRLLQHSSLTEINRTLTDGIDLDAFLAESDKLRAVGGGKLAWPDDPHQELGLTLLLIWRLGGDPHFSVNFSHSYYSDRSTKIIDGIRAMTTQLVMPFVRDYKTYVLNAGRVEPQLRREKSNRIFIVHGHDGEAKETVARFVQGIDLVPVILHEQPSRGGTIIEKIERYADVGFAVILLTPDDEGRAIGTIPLESRARQNVLLELGYFTARLGRENICTLMRGEVAMPSDFAGIVWETMDSKGGWKTSLGKELQAAGYAIKWNKAMRN